MQIHREKSISIHAPSRERLKDTRVQGQGSHFNPRSLAGATITPPTQSRYCRRISIHAPSRERPPGLTLSNAPGVISIHAPSRERPKCAHIVGGTNKFQSTLPRGSDLLQALCISITAFYFNPRSLAGATKNIMPLTPIVGISIHAPSRERPVPATFIYVHHYFNPRSLAGATGNMYYYYSCARFQSTLPRGSDTIWLA